MQLQTIHVKSTLHLAISDLQTYRKLLRPVKDCDLLQVEFGAGKSYVSWLVCAGEKKFQECMLVSESQ